MTQRIARVSDMNLLSNMALHIQAYHTEIVEMKAKLMKAEAAVETNLQIIQRQSVELQDTRIKTKKLIDAATELVIGRPVEFKHKEAVEQATTVLGDWKPPVEPETEEWD